MKTETIRFRCAKEQRDKIEKKAESLGLTMSAYITMLITKDTAEYPEIIGNVNEK